MAAGQPVSQLGFHPCQERIDFFGSTLPQIIDATIQGAGKLGRDGSISPKMIEVAIVVGLRLRKRFVAIRHGILLRKHMGYRTA